MRVAQSQYRRNIFAFEGEREEKCKNENGVLGEGSEGRGCQKEEKSVYKKIILGKNKEEKRRGK